MMYEVIAFRLGMIIIVGIMIRYIIKVVLIGEGMKRVVKIK
jgi:hypothetical protein